MVDSKVRIHLVRNEIVLIPNQMVYDGNHISGWFGISAAGINTRVIRRILGKHNSSSVHNAVELTRTHKQL